MTQNEDCCPDCGTDRAALRQKILEVEAEMVVEKVQLRIEVEKRMAEAGDATTLLDALERAGVDLGELLFP